MHDADRWHRVEQMFHSALELDPAARDEYLMGKCGGDHNLRRRVESLLARDEAASPIDHSISPESAVRSFGRYRVLSNLGEGGMGTVYLARDTQLNRDVALKVLPPVFAIDAERRRRFIREARAASSLSHPNIVPVYDFGEEGGVEYFVMEYIPGKPLDRLIPRTGLKLDEALDYAIPIASALQAAHEAGIVHRDIKPGNVMVAGRGIPKILDFGIAKVAQERSVASAVPSGTVTGEGMVLGTVAYMSPEQAEGRPVDARSDIFSFGSLLYEMMTGRRAFDRGSNASTLTAILRDDPPRADSVVQGIPAALCGVLDKCLRKGPAERYERMADVLAELGGVRPAVISSGRQASSFVWYTVAGLLLVATLVAGWWLVRNSGDSANPARAGTTASSSADSGFRLIPVTSYPGEEYGPSFSPDGNQIAFIHREPGASTSHLFIKLIGENEAVQLTHAESSDLSPSWSSDGRSIAFLRAGASVSGDHAGRPWALMLIPAIGGPERKLADLAANWKVRFGISWHPSGKWIAFTDRTSSGAQDAIQIVSVADGVRRQLTAPEPEVGHISPAFSRTGEVSYLHGSARQTICICLS